MVALLVIFLFGFWIKNVKTPSFEEKNLPPEKSLSVVTGPARPSFQQAETTEHPTPSKIQSPPNSSISNEEFLELSINTAQKELLNSEVGFCEVKTSSDCLSLDTEDISYEGLNSLPSKKWDELLSSADKTWSLSSVFDVEARISVTLEEEINLNKEDEPIKIKLLENLESEEGEKLAPAGAEFKAVLNPKPEESRNLVQCFAKRSQCADGSFSSVYETELLEIMSPEKYINYLIEREKLENYIKDPKENGSDMYDKSWYDQKLQFLLENELY